MTPEELEEAITRIVNLVEYDREAAIQEGRNEVCQRSIGTEELDKLQDTTAVRWCIREALSRACRYTAGGYAFYQEVRTPVDFARLGVSGVWLFRDESVYQEAQALVAQLNALALQQ